MFPIMHHLTAVMNQNKKSKIRSLWLKYFIVSNGSTQLGKDHQTKCLFTQWVCSDRTVYLALRAENGQKVLLVGVLIQNPSYLRPGIAAQIAQTLISFFEKFNQITWNSSRKDRL